MKKSIFTLLSICLIILSCKKDKTDPVSPIADKPYSNTVDGTRWTYRVVTDSGTAMQTSLIDTLTVSGGDTSINQKTYKIVRHTNGNTESYFNVTGNDYYQFQQVAAAGAQIEQLYLKDNVAAGGTWTQDVSVTLTGFPTALPLHLTYTVAEKGITKVVSGITYNDVISVTTSITSTLLPDQITSDIKSYYARNIGLIEGDYNVDVPVATVSIHTNNFLQSAELH